MMLILQRVVLHVQLHGGIAPLLSAYPHLHGRAGEYWLTYPLEAECCDSAEKGMPVTTNEMLLRGCMLKNSNYVLGLVVYTGKESRIQMNAAKTPNKVGETLNPFAHGESWPFSSHTCKAIV